MATNLQRPNVSWGVAAGILPKGGPLILNVPLDLTTAGGNGVGTIDVQKEIEADVIDFVQSVFLDNSLGTVPLILNITVTGQKIQCPPSSQGVFLVAMVPGGSLINVTGDKLAYLIQLFNMPMAPSVWKATS